MSVFTKSLASLHCLGFPINWNEYFDLTENPASLLHLDTYQWNYKNYWIQYEGSWTLDKAHAGQVSNQSAPATVTRFFTSSVQQIIFEDYNDSVGRMTALTNLHHPDLVGAADGHKLNGRSVITGVCKPKLTLITFLSVLATNFIFRAFGQILL